MSKRLRNPAFIWHCVDVGFAISGVLGHIWLARRLARKTWHESRPRIA